MQERRNVDSTVIMAIAGILGGIVGFVIWITADAFVFLPVFLAAGIVTGVAIAEARDR